MNKFLPFCLLALCGSAPADDAKPVAQVTIKSTGKALGVTPILVPLQAKIAPGNYLLKSGADTAARASVFTEGETTYLSAVLNSIPQSGDTIAQLVPTSTSDGINLSASKKASTITFDGKPFTTYLPDNGPKPTLFPLIGPTGKPFTRAYPMQDIEGEKRDHPHHRSFWFTHGKVNGIDFWSELKGHGSIVETSFKSVSTPTLATIATTDDWLGPDGKLVLKDERTTRFTATADERIVDFDITLKATDGPVVFGDTKEGMFGVRVATSMDVLSKKGGKITTSEGLTDDKAWGKPAGWVDYTGPVDNETVGIAILNHPSSFRYPTTWHVRTYGLFAANPFGWHDFGLGKSAEHTVPAGGSIKFGYRVILHKGDTASANIAAQFESYANPPKVEVKAE